MAVQGHVEEDRDDVCLQLGLQMLADFTRYPIALLVEAIDGALCYGE